MQPMLQAPDAYFSSSSFSSFYLHFHLIFLSLSFFIFILNTKLLDFYLHFHLIFFLSFSLFIFLFQDKIARFANLPEGYFYGKSNQRTSYEISLYWSEPISWAVCQRVSGVISMQFDGFTTWLGPFLRNLEILFQSPSHYFNLLWYSLPPIFFIFPFFIIQPLIHGFNARRCPMSPHFLTR